jgi:hypothetical protein
VGEKIREYNNVREIEGEMLWRKRDHRERERYAGERRKVHS